MIDTGHLAKARVGIPGLDDILLGGLRRDRLFLIEGSPGERPRWRCNSYLKAHGVMRQDFT